jgi:hypothetical protein
MTDLSPFAAGARARFGDAGVHARVRSGRTVHAVQLGQWVGGEEVPDLACHTGIGGFDPAALEPTREPVTCARCLRILGGTYPETQLPLFDHDR